MTSKLNIRSTTVAVCQIAVCAALLCVLSPLSVPTPLNIAFTLQVLIVLLTALVLKPLYAFAAQMIYTLLGIDDIMADDKATFYNLQGVKVEKPVKGQTYVVRKAVNGKTTTIKIRM